jgi:multidrug efflux system membrane fusion protein
MTTPRRARCLLLGLSLSLLLPLAGCNRDASAAAQNKKKPIINVIVAPVVRKDMPVIVRAIGRVSSPATVSVKPQVTGTIAKVHFTDGQNVKQGDQLITIDPRSFEATREQARASLAEANTKAANADEQLTRYRSLDKAGSASKEQVSDFEVAAKVAKSAVQVAEAAVKTADLQVEYCNIRAPISGRAGKALVTAGNVITANQTDLVVLNQLAPVEVTFSAAEQQLGAIQAALAAGKPKVTATIAGKERQASEGELIFVDNVVKATTGTIELKAAFRNEPQLLWPGQFVELRLQVALDKNAVVAPAAGVQDGQDTSFVFIVKPDKTTEMRKVVVDRTANDETVIRSGLEGGEEIVVDGQSRLTKGSTVQVVPASTIPRPTGTEPPPPLIKPSANGEAPVPAKSPAPAAPSAQAKP